MATNKARTHDPEEAKIKLAIAEDTVSIVDLVNSHYLSTEQHNKDSDSRARYAKLHDKALRIYDERQGPIRRSFFSDVAWMWVLLAERDGLKIGCRPKATDMIRLTNSAQRVAGYAHEFVGESGLTRLARYARARVSKGWWNSLLGYFVERGNRRRWHCLNIVYAAINQAMGNMEERVRREKLEPTRSDHEFMDHLHEDLARAEQIPAKTARLVYIRGLFIGLGFIALFSVFVGPLAERATNEIFAGTIPQIALIFGGLGATLSVLQRLQRDAVSIDLGAGRASLRFSATIRPVFGAVAGLLIYMIHVSGIFLPDVSIGDPATAPLFYAVVAFGAGFGERAFEDTLGVVRLATN